MVATIEQKVTWDEYRNMEFDDHDLFIYELLNGNLVRRTAPSVTHQRISRKMLRFLDTFVSEKKLGEVFTAPIDVYFDGKNGVQPDLIFIKTERLSIIENEDYVNGAPDLVIEVISPGSIRRDRVDKKDLFEQFAVKEFWLIDPQNKTIEIYTMEDNAYRLHEFQEQEGKITSLVLEGFEIDVKDVFESSAI